MSIIDDIEAELQEQLTNALQKTRDEYAANGASGRYFVQIRCLMAAMNELYGGMIADPFYPPIFKSEAPRDK